MLSRVADTLYWMSRYLERAENISRFVEVNWHLSLENSRNSSQDRNENQDWDALISVTGDNNMFLECCNTYSRENVIKFLFFDTAYPHSIISCLRAARENARTVREIISADMWEQINAFYHFVENMGKRSDGIHNNPYEFCQSIQLRSVLIKGLTNDTMIHGEGWHFVRLGRYLERADKTSRILDVKYFTLAPKTDPGGDAFDDVQWAALLRATGGLEAYRQKCGRIFPESVSQFLIFERQFARSILRCLIVAQKSLHAISSTPVGAYQNKAEQRMGALLSELAYTDIAAVFEQGLHPFTDQLQLKMNHLNDGISETFFGYEVEPSIDENGKRRVSGADE